MNEVININTKKIGIHEYGDKNGFPVFYFHGFPGSRLDGYLFDFEEIATNLNIRIISLDRPGIGLSDFNKKRKLLDWPILVSSVADRLNIKEFSVLGLSGGGPYALACAYSIPEMIYSVSIVSGIGPLSYKETKNDLALIIPKQIRPIRLLIAWGLKKGVIKNPEKVIKNINKSLPAIDMKFLNQKNRISELLNVFIECFKQGLDGYLKEAEIYRNDWGFKLTDIKANVKIWHGTADRNVSVDLANRISGEILNCKTRIIENEGHFSLTGNYLRDILTDLKK